MMSQLSSRSILEILNGLTPEKPLLQVINIKKITAPNTKDRYRLLLSDGENTYSHVMLAAQMNKFLESDELTNFAVIKANKYMCNQLGDKRVIILLELTVVSSGSDIQEKIGNPTPLNPTNIPKLSEESSRSENHVETNNVPSKPPTVQGSSTALKNNFNNNLTKGGTPGTPGSKVHPIASLTPYQNRWRIRARVTLKSSIRTWSNSRGEGKLFNVNLLDDSGEIRLTGFNEQVDKYFDMLEVNKIYYISKCTLKTANKQYSNLKNDYEMTMNPETTIDLCTDDVSMPTITYDFVKISDLEKCNPNSNIDLIGIVKVCNDVGSVVSKSTQKEITKRDIQVVDQSGVSVNVTLWGDEAVKFDGQGCPIITLKGARVSDFGGRSLSVSAGTSMIMNADMKEAHQLRGWWDSEGRNMSYSSFQSEGGSGSSQSTNWKLFQQVKDENLGQGDKADYYSSKGTVMFIKKDNCMYQACPTDQCNKKLIDMGNGLFRCEKCSKEFPNYKWRMILQANIADHSDNQWVTCFQESAEQMLSCSADDLGAMREQDEVQFDAVMREALFKQYEFRLRSKVETYNDESRMKTVCVGVKPINWREYGNRLIEQLNTMGV